MIFYREITKCNPHIFELSGVFITLVLTDNIDKQWSASYLLEYCTRVGSRPIMPPINKLHIVVMQAKKVTNKQF